MQALLFIPWFKLETIKVPLPSWAPFDHLPIQPFGILVAVGVLLGIKLAEKRAKELGLHHSVMSDFNGHVLVTGFVSCYFLNWLMYDVIDAAIFHPEKLSEVLQYPFNRYLGLSSFGGFFGALLGVYIWKRRRKLPALPPAEVMVWAFPLGWLFGRMGCFSVHDHPGAITDFPLAVADYQVGEPPFEPRHDLGFYEVLWSLGCLAIFFLLKRKPRNWGFFLALFALLYTPVRFGLDFLRAGPDDGGDVRYFGLTPGHYSSLALFIASAIFMYWVMTKSTSVLPPELKEPIEGRAPRK